MQITGMPDKFNPANPYPLFDNLKKSLEEKNTLQCGLRKGHPVLVNIQTTQHNIEICPPFWNGEIRWKESNCKKILRTGHQFLALHSLFDEQNPYTNYKDSFEHTFEKLIKYLEKCQVFETIELRIRYINAIKLKTQQNGEFNIKNYFNAGFFHHLDHPLRIRNSGFNYEFSSNDIILGVNTRIKALPLPQSNLLAVIETTGIKELKEKIHLNDAKNILKQTRLIKEELKTTFFNVMTDNTKDNIMGVQYA